MKNDQMNENKNLTSSPLSWSLIGIPDHLAVGTLNGRKGSALGPKYFRRYFFKMNGKCPIFESISFNKDVAISNHSIKENHLQAIQTIHEGHLNSSFSIVIGGSHDHGYTHLEGIKQALADKSKRDFSLGCINIDAHFDVRKPDPEISSGSPFFLALERNVLSSKNFIEFGIQEHCNSSKLWDYVSEKKITCVPFTELRHNAAVEKFKSCLLELSQQCDAIVISLDLDALSEAYAPGVSAPQAEGFSASEIMEILEFSGTIPQVVSLGVFELNPLHDLGDKTSRLAATFVYHFIASKLSGEPYEK